MARGRPWSAEDSARLRQLVQAGTIDLEIARALGRARETITRKRKLLGLAPGGSPENRATLLRIAATRVANRMTEQDNLQERPKTYTPELGQELCRRLSDGSPLGG